MAFLIVRLAEVENREDITNNQGDLVGAKIKFKYLADRELFVGGDSHGTTNTTVELPIGTHTLTLGPPRDHTPKKMKIVLKETTVISPMEVRFEKI